MPVTIDITQKIIAKKFLYNLTDWIKWCILLMRRNNDTYLVSIYQYLAFVHEGRLYGYNQTIIQLKGSVISMKRTFSIFLVLVMVLSIASMAAFAAVNMDCGHGDPEEYERELGIPTFVSATKHRCTYVTIHECRVCGLVQESAQYYRNMNHSFHKYVLVDEYQESGETVYKYAKTCRCGFTIGYITCNEPKN